MMPGIQQIARDARFAIIRLRREEYETVAGTEERMLASAALERAVGRAEYLESLLLGRLPV